MKFGDDVDTFKDFAVAFGAFLGEIEWHGCSLRAAICCQNFTQTQNSKLELET